MSQPIPDKFVPLCQKQDEHRGCIHMLKYQRIYRSDDPPLPPHCSQATRGKEITCCPCNMWPLKDPPQYD